MGLLDSLFDPAQYGDQTGGLLSRLSQLVGTQQFQPSQGFPAQQGPSFSDRFSALPNADAPSMATPMNIGSDYQMPRLGSEAQFAATPQAAQPAQGQLPMQQPQMAPQQEQQTLPTFLDSRGGFGAGLRGIANNMQGGPIGALMGGIGSAMGMQDPAQQNLAAQHGAIFKALIANGDSPQVAFNKAMVAVTNPEAAKTILPELFTTKEKFQKTGQDPLTGVEQFGFVNERDQTVNGRPMGAQPSNAASIGDPSLTGDAYLKSLPEGMQAQVKAIVEGRMQPPSGFALKSPQIQALVRAAAQYEPGFDMTKWSQRVGTVKDFASGQAAKNVTSLNTVIGHLSDLKEKADALNNWSVPAINTVGNAINNATGGPEVNNFNLARNAVADELAKVFKGSGISDHEIAQWKETLNASQSPAQLKGAVKTAIGLMDSRLSALTDQRDRGMSTQSEPRSLLNEKSKAGLAKIEAWADGKSETKAAGGITEGATATNPQTGAKLTFRNGKWQ